VSVFGPYARYYDLLYRDKDYSSEAHFVSGLIRKHAPDARRLIELGSGTGIHASLLAQDGLSVHGVDRSETMLESARGRLKTLDPAVAARLTFSAGDVRNVRVGQTFDVAISLFHVVSYQVTNDDLLAMFQTAATHLERGGLFVFDFWFTSAVLSERPVVRIKRLESDEIAVTRLAEPELNTADAYVDVNYHVFVRDKTSGATEELRESHRMRYLSLGEVDLLARASGFTVLESCEWMTGRQPGADTWGVCSVLRKT
jgi:SAM-dependent methyltransferase